MNKLIINGDAHVIITNKIRAMFITSPSGCGALIYKDNNISYVWTTIRTIRNQIIDKWHA